MGDIRILVLCLCVYDVPMCMCKRESRLRLVMRVMCDVDSSGVKISSIRISRNDRCMQKARLDVDSETISSMYSTSRYTHCWETRGDGGTLGTKVQ